MRFLKKVIIALILIVLLAVFKILFARIFPSSASFHYNFLSCLQLFLLSWAVITGLSERFLWQRNGPEKSRRISFAVFISLMGLAEFLCFFLLHHPRFIPGKMLRSFRYFYNNYQRDVLQYNSHIAKYDTAVFYKMKPDNRSLFSNIEFSDSIFTNSLGFRDDDIPAEKEKIICLGDSYTLGWGVQQQETYAQQLENLVKAPVLNTGMSSYGTAREVRSVSGLDISGVKDIIIQYCYNDDDENEMYMKNNDHLPVSPERVYDSAQDALKWSNLYFPGKYFFTIAKIFLKEKINVGEAQTTGESNAGGYQRSAQLFIEVLKGSGWDFNKVHVVVFDIGEYERLSDGFILALEKELGKTENVDVLKNHIHPLHIASLLKPDDFYLLDAHIKASGHKKIADAIARALNNMK